MNGSHSFRQCGTAFAIRIERAAFLFVPKALLAAACPRHLEVPYAQTARLESVSQFFRVLRRRAFGRMNVRQLKQWHGRCLCFVALEAIMYRDRALRNVIGSSDAISPASKILLTARCRAVWLSETSFFT